jgi:hypothetical protein
MFYYIDNALIYNTLNFRAGFHKGLYKKERAGERPLPAVISTLNPITD